MRTVSIATMIEQIFGLLGTQDLTDWEREFVTNVAGRAKAMGTTKLSERQVMTIERIWAKHFA